MNKIIIKGRLAKEVELRTTQQNKSIINTSVAVNKKFAKEGEVTADFFNITAFGTTADFINKYFVKGQEILIEGRVQNETWEDKQGQKRYITKIIAEQVEFCGNKKATESEETPSFIEIADDDDLPF